MTTTQVNVVNTPDQLHALCEELQGCDVLAIDTEFMREKTYYAQFCLLQIATDKVLACVDPLALPDMGPLLQIIYDRRVLKVMHAARQDLELFYNLSGALPGPVFDTQIAAALLGMGMQVSYAALVKALLGTELDKSHARTDWSRRPLDEGQLHYAADDVRHLLAVYRQQHQQLESMDRLTWLRDDFEALEDLGRYQNRISDAWTRIGGAQFLKDVRLAVVRDLAAWREQQAMHQNRPRKWLATDECLVDIARLLPKSIAELNKVRDLPPAFIERFGAALLQVVEQACAQPRDQWPVLPRHQRPSETQEAVVDVLMAVVRYAATQNKISPQVLATRKDLEHLVSGEQDIGVLSGWRKALVGDELCEVLAGRHSVQIHHGELVLITSESV